MKDRFTRCIYYEFEGSCKKGHEGTFYKACQHCPDYVRDKKSRPAKLNLKKQKLQAIKNKEVLD